MNNIKKKHAVFIDPSSEHYHQDKLFDTQNSYLNRDGTLLPFARLKNILNAKGIIVHTADLLRDGLIRADINHYWSFGILNGYQELIGQEDVKLQGFVILEPPIIAPNLYRELPRLSNIFKNIYLHNTFGDGYSLRGVCRDRLQKLYWPQPFDNIVEPQWSNIRRINKMVVIAGLHNPRFRKPELYSKRIEAISSLGKVGALDLYGRGWNKWWTIDAATLKYWTNFKNINKAYLGECSSKLDILSKYRFSLCFENTQMSGFVTEKIFDCFYAGTVPVYLGAPNISKFIPEDAYIDFRDFRGKNFENMWKAIASMSEDEWIRKRNAGKNFILNGGKNYYDSLIKMFL